MALANPDQNIWYVAPTFRMAKRLAWRPLKAIADYRALVGKPNETGLQIEFKNGSIISLFGADNYDSLRGDGINHVIVDEFALIKPEVWFEVIRPALADTGGTADLFSTPKGFNWAYDLCMDALTKPNWHFFQYTTAQGGNVPLEELEDARASMDRRIYRQEFEASFETLAGQIYDNFSRSANLDDEVTDIPSQPLLVGMDFNVNPMSAVLAVANGAEECWVFDTIEMLTSNTEMMARELRYRYPEREIICYPDASGKARKTSASVGETDFSILQGYNIRIVAPESNPPVVDRINNTQANLCDAKGKRHLLIHPRCKPLIKSLEGHCYKDGTSIPDKQGNPDLSHFNDALGMLLWGHFHRFKAPFRIPTGVYRKR